MNALFGWMPGTFDMLIIAFIALLLFGNRLPSMMRNMGRGVQEFKKGMQDPHDEPDADAEEPPRKIIAKEPEDVRTVETPAKEPATKSS